MKYKVVILALLGFFSSGSFCGSNSVCTEYPGALICENGMSSKNPLTYEQQFFSEISELLRTGREAAYRSVNLIMVNTYWHYTLCNQFKLVSFTFNYAFR